MVPVVHFSLLQNGSAFIAIFFQFCSITFLGVNGSVSLAPNPMTAWTPRAVTLVSKQLADGVFVVYDKSADSAAPQGVPAATSGGFIIGYKGVLLVETMINRQLFCQMIGLVKEQTNQPIMYTVNTSHHGDHSYGNSFLPSEVKVVQHANRAKFITTPASFAGDKQFMEANFGSDQGIDEIQARKADIEVGAEGWSVDFGNRKVDARYLGFGQTHGDLFVHVPGANVVWTGNPLVARGPAIPWLLDGHAKDVRTTLAALRTSFPGATIVPGHDAPRPISDIDFSINYLDALVSGVEGAVAEGKTLDETVEAVSLKEFQGYGLWGWVHNQVNVPATYAELSK